MYAIYVLEIKRYVGKALGTDGEKRMKGTKSRHGCGGQIAEEA
jgi:hypothetical protein